MFLFTRSSQWHCSMKLSVLCGKGFKNLNHRENNVSQRRSHRGDFLVRNHSFHFRRIRIAHYDTAAEPAFALLVLRGEDVPQECMRPLYFSRRGFLEAFGGALVCF
jgi:hypothetical protein